jgi:hypothetical protein
MYVEHELAQAPDDADAIIWRYVDLPKLIRMFQTGSLWFARADTLGDPHEGAYGLAAQMRAPRRVVSGIPYALGTGMGVANARVVSHTYINSWHLSPVESAAMWKIYAGDGQGIAIRSTFDRLCKSLTSPMPEVVIGKIEYVDVGTAVVPTGNVFRPFFIKRPPFAYEHELRAMFLHGDDSGQPVGINVDADLSVLLDAIVISPHCPQWFSEAVAAVAERLGPAGVTVVDSTMSLPPAF